MGLLAAGPARADGPAWTTLPALPDAGANFTPRIAVGPNNDSVATWTVTQGTKRSIAVATLPAGPGMPTVKTFDRTNTSGFVNPSPQVSLAPTGDALVAWREGGSSHPNVAFTLRRAPGDFADPKVLTVPTFSGKDKVTTSPVVATDKAGHFLVVASDEVPPVTSGDANFRERILVWTVDGDTGLVSGPEVVAQTSPAASNPYFSIAVGEGPDGAATLAFADAVSVLFASSRTGPGAAFGAPVTLDPAGGTRLRVAQNADGRTLVAWQGFNTQPRAVERQPGSATYSPLNGAADAGLADLASSSEQPTIALDPSGRGTILFSTCTGCTGANPTPNVKILALSVKPDGSTEGAPTELATATKRDLLTTPEVAAAANGDVVASWRLATPTGVEIETARRAGGAGAWTRLVVPQADTPRSLSSSPGSSIAMDATGDAELMWASAPTASGFVPRLARLDAAPPVPGDITVRGGQAGSDEPLFFTLAPKDAVSDIDSVSWDFGDGSKAAGTSVRHLYDDNGRRTVHATVTDVAGFSADATIDVGAGAPKPKPVLPRLLGGLGASRTSFRVGQGTTLRYRLTKAAKVTLTAAHLVPGRRRDGKCKQPTRKGGRRCTRALGVGGSVTQKGHAGRNALKFSGRLGGKGLGSGRYRLTLQLSRRASASTVVTILR